MKREGEKEEEHAATLDRCNEGENCLDEKFPFVILRFFNLLCYYARERFIAPTFSLIEYLIRRGGKNNSRHLITKLSNEVGPIVESKICQLHFFDRRLRYVNELSILEISITISNAVVPNIL